MVLTLKKYYRNVEDISNGIYLIQFNGNSVGVVDN
jgi:hypothetical protein